MSILDDPRIRSRVFFPRRDGVRPDLVVDVGDAELGCFVRRAGRGASCGLVLHFHGNGELASSYAEEHEVLEGLDVDRCYVEYRGYGSSTGEPGLARMLGDGAKVVEALGVPPERIVAFGRSMGSLYAVELARRFPNLGGVILESGIANVLEMRAFARDPDELGIPFDDLAAAARASLDQEAKLRAYPGPVLVLHALGDSLLPASHGRRLEKWARSREKGLVLFPRGDHNTILLMNFREYRDEVAGFLRRVGLTGPAAAARPSE